MNLESFKNQISSAGLSRSYNWVCRIYPPASLSSITNQMQVETSPTQGGNRVNLNLPGVTIGGNLQNSFPIGDLGTAKLNIGNINLGLPNHGYTISNIGAVVESLNLYCAGCSIPSRDVENFESNEWGEKRVFGARHTHSPFKIKYYCSENLFERFFFESWQDRIFNSVSKQYGYYNDYISTVEIYKYNAGWSKVEAIYKLEEAYPSNVGELGLNHVNDGILQLDISFKYRTYKRVK